MRINNHWLEPAFHCLSPNHNDRPDNTDISLLVIHCISLPPGQFGNDYIKQLFCNELDPQQHPYFKEIYQQTVSSHILIQRDGTITQYVAFDKRAWHAGQSEYQGRQSCNDFSIGIELEGTDNSPYETIQYQQLATLVKTLLDYYPNLSSERITGHSDIAPGRKTDPGRRFDWRQLHTLLNNTA